MTTRTFQFPVVAPIISDPSTPSWVYNTAIGAWRDLGAATNRAAAFPDAENVGSVTGQLGSWSGAAPRNDGAWMYIAMSGGHSDYGGNGVFALQLGTETPQWHRLKAHSPISVMPAYRYTQATTGGVPNPEYVPGAGFFYDDGCPAPKHTYQGIVYDSTLNAVVVFGGGTYNGVVSQTSGGTGTLYLSAGALATNVFSLATNSWGAPGALAKVPGGIVAPIGGAIDPTTGKVYLNPAGQRLYEWNPATQTYADYGPAMHSLAYGSLMVDNSRRQLLLIGQYQGAAGLKIRSLTPGSASQTVSLTGPLASKLWYGYEGFTHDTDADMYYVMEVSAQYYTVPNVYSIDPKNNYFCTQLTVPPTLTGSRSAVCNRFWYFPQLRGIAYLPNSAYNAWYLRLH